MKVYERDLMFIMVYGGVWDSFDVYNALWRCMGEYGCL